MHGLILGSTGQKKSVKAASKGGYVLKSPFELGLSLINETGKSIISNMENFKHTNMLVTLAAYIGKSSY